MKYSYNYKVDLPEDVPTILDQDYWVIENIGPEILNSLNEPVKFSATTWVFVKKGKCNADINLINHDISGPALVTVENSQILQPKFISDDFMASILVMSKRFHDNLFLFMSNMPLYAIISRHPVAPISSETIGEIDPFFAQCRRIIEDSGNPYQSQAFLFQVTSFIFKTLYKWFEPYQEEVSTNQGRMSDQFLTLAQKHFKQERFLDFYAQKLEVTPKHLSRTLKSQTGFTAVEWIERFVILEAKVLLKSSNLNIQQISDELNFPSQSFFGKYFKKLTGMSPKEFRNS